MNDFPVSKDSYVAFDGLSLKEKIKERLNQTGIFTDQNFEGSNLAAINDAFAMLFSLLLYTTNQSSVNGSFTLTNLYENMNRIIKFINYNPIGYQTASLNFNLSAESLNSGIWSIPRYSVISLAGIPYSLTKDITFTKTLNQTKEAIEGISDDSILYQGSFVEYPVVIPSGNSNETIILSVEDSVIIDNFNIDVYVNENGTWEKWNRTQSLFLNSYNDKVYEVRFNENKKYEIKFGDDVNGKKLTTDNQVAIYYLKSNGKSGEVGVSALTNRRMALFNTTQLNSILTNVSDLTYIPSNQIMNLSFDNKFPSTFYSDHESIDSIRKNAPASFKSQFNVTTKKSYENFIRTNFSNIIQDVAIKNNKEYLNTYMKYFYDLGLTKPQNESRALFNQVNFSDACNFNNVYAFIVPKTIQNTLTYLNNAQKQLIVQSIEEEKVLTSDLIPMDPVYIAFDLYVSGTTDDRENIANSELYIIKSTNSRRNESSIKEDIQNTILSFFDAKNNTLGQEININQLNTNIKSIDGVAQVYTRNKSTNSILEGVNFLSWNPTYFDVSKQRIVDTTKLTDFQFPYLNNISFVDRITIV